MGGAAMFQALQNGTIDAGEFIGPWTDSALGYYQVCKYYYWPGIYEPSSAEECAVNKDVFDALPDDLKQAVTYACQSLYNQVWTEYTTNHARALDQLVRDQGVLVRRLPDPVIDAMADAGRAVIAELREDDDALTREIVESFLTYRAAMVDYMRYADNGDRRRAP